MVYCSRSGPPIAAVAGAGRQRPARGAGRRGRDRRRGGPDRVRLRPHGGQSTTSTPRPPRPPSGSGCGWCACRPSAPTTSSSPGWSTWRSSAPAEARGEAVPTPAWPGSDVRPAVCPRGLLPQPARRQAGPVRVRTDARRHPRRPTSWPSSRSWPSRLATEAGRFIVDERPAELGVAETKSSATDVVTVMDQRAEELLRRRIAAARPDDAIVGEEAAATRRQLRHHLGGRPHRRHRQLPLRHPRRTAVSVAAVDRGRVGARRLAPRRGRGLQPQHR